MTSFERNNSAHRPRHDCRPGPWGARAKPRRSLSFTFFRIPDICSSRCSFPMFMRARGLFVSHAFESVSLVLHWSDLSLMSCAQLFFVFLSADCPRHASLLIARVEVHSDAHRRPRQTSTNVRKMFRFFLPTVLPKYEYDRDAASCAHPAHVGDAHTPAPASVESQSAVRPAEPTTI